MSLIRNVTTTTTPDELQVRNGQDHKRVYNPDGNTLQEAILAELKINNLYLSHLTGENFSHEDIEE